MSKPVGVLLPLPFVLESLAAPGVVPLEGDWTPRAHRTPDHAPSSPMLALNGKGRARVAAGERERKPSPSRREIEAWGGCVCWDYEDENAPCTCGART